MKKILFTGVAPFNPQYGGVERVTDSLCRSLIRNGYDVEYLCFDEEAKRDVFEYPCSSTFLPVSNDILHGDNVAFYQRYLREHSIDVVINQNGLYEGSYLFCDKGNSSAKIISVIHNNPVGNYHHLFSDLIAKRNGTFKELLLRYVRALLWFEVKYRVHRGMRVHYKFLLEKSDAIIVLSPSYLPIVREIDKRLMAKTISIFNPNTYPEQNSIPQKKQHVLYAGRLHSQKKIERLLKIWQMVCDEIGTWQLDIVGDGDEREKLQNICQSCHISKVNFWGRQDPERFYRDASIICLTSDFEGFPMVLTEAMQFGCVPVAFDSFPAVRDVIVPDETGILISPFNLKEYAEKLKFLVVNEQFREKLSLAAFEHVKRFDVNKVTDNWVGLFDRL